LGENMSCLPDSGFQAEATSPKGIGSKPCLLCHPDPSRVFYEDDLVLALWEDGSGSEGHALISPRRHIASWCQASPQERHALVDATVALEAMLFARHGSKGYDLGLNSGRVEGSAAFHLHLHVIPRSPARDPRPPGPEAGNPPHRRPLVRGGRDPFAPHLLAAMEASCGLDIAVAFLLPNGLRRIGRALEAFLGRGGRLRLLTGDYMDVTDPEALETLLRMRSRHDFQARVYETAGNGTFHPKCYLFHHADGTGTAFVGSSNLSGAALGNGLEWNYRVHSGRDAAGVEEVRLAFEHLFNSPRTLDLDPHWIAAYRSRRRPSLSLEAGHPLDDLPPATAERVAEPEGTESGPRVFTPHAIQQEALDALARTREEGNRAGLVVLATGLGKTWLAAFDSMDFRRVLFVAHREEILSQAMQTFARLRPGASLGLYTGQEKSVHADLVFASIQTMGRTEHLAGLDRRTFDYIVVDEFHHAEAPTYRRLLDHFTPQFLLGLTATPERSDGGNLLALCSENLVYRCDLPEGVARGLLCPFIYFGIPDEVEYQNIPWRSNRFDEAALTEAVATRSRARNALDQLLANGGQRALAFCVSVRHADFMRDFFNEHGVAAAAVHSGPTSDHRSEALAALGRGELRVVCAVDMFNEGVDLPVIDTVLMLRPTESRILWLQQLGRGLRKAVEKTHLAVIDYIGNHRTFLRKAEILFSLQSGRATLAHALRLLEEGRAGELGLPPGCAVNYDLRSIEILKALMPREVDSLPQFYLDFKEHHGGRPRALEAMHEGHRPGRAGHRFWCEFIHQSGDLPGGDLLLDSALGDFLRHLERTPMSRSYKMVLLEAMLEEGRFPGQMSLEDLALAFARVAGRSARLREDLSVDFTRPEQVQSLLKRMPIKAWTTQQHGRYFTFSEGILRSNLDVPPALRPSFLELVREIVEWRMAQYLERRLEA